MTAFFSNLFGNGMWQTYLEAVLLTLKITVIGTAISYIIGIPLGVLLYGTAAGSLFENRWVNTIVGVVVNVLRSVPFIILLVMTQPIAKAIVGSKIGNNAFIVYLVLAAAPFVARMIESSFKEVDPGVIEAAQSMGSTNIQIIFKVLIPEAKPSLIVGAAIALTTILGYTAMSGIIGGGGLGKIAINYGYYRYKYLVMLFAVIILILLVQVFQSIGTHLAARLDKRIKR